MVSVKIKCKLHVYRRAIKVLMKSWNLVISDRYIFFGVCMHIIHNVHELGVTIFSMNFIPLNFYSFSPAIECSQQYIM